MGGGVIDWLRLIFEGVLIFFLAIVRFAIGAKQLQLARLHFVDEFWAHVPSGAEAIPFLRRSSLK